MAHLPAGAPLPQALEALARKFTSRTGIAVRVEATKLDLAPEVESELLGIAQEALTNVGKHARATVVDIVLGRRARTARLTIRDDGIGYRARKGGAGHGIIGMRERAQLLKGAVTITSSGGYTRVRVTVPLAK